MSAPPRRLRPVHFVLAALGCLWLGGTVAFALAAPTCLVHLPRLAEHPSERHDLVDYRYGPILEASTSDFAHQQHPAFLVDGAARPSPTEAWVSMARDEHPWLEMRWSSPKRVDEVVLTRAAAPRATGDRPEVTVRCLGASGELAVRGEKSSVTHHPLVCEGAHGVRLEFGGPVNLLEIEVMGQ